MDLTDAEQRALWQSYLARMKEDRELDAEFGSGYVPYLNYLGHFRGLESPPPPAGPTTPAPPKLDRPGTLTVNRYWLAPQRPEVQALKLPRKVAPRHFQYRDGELWFMNRSGRQVFHVNLETSAAECLALPDNGRDPQRDYSYPDELEVTPDYVFVHERPGIAPPPPPKTPKTPKTPLVGGLVIDIPNWQVIRKYDRRAKRWSVVDVPPMAYAGRYIAPYYYLLFGHAATDSLRDVEQAGVGAGLYRLDPRTDTVELLASTRRKPALNTLDDSELYRPLTVFTGAADRLHLIVARGEPDTTERTIYRRTEDGRDWEEVVTITDDFYWRDGSDGVLLRNRGRYTPSSLNQIVYLGRQGDETELAHVLLGNSLTLRKPLLPGEPQWQLPDKFNGPGHGDWKYDADYDGQALRLMTGRHSVKQDQTLHVYRPERKLAASIPLKFVLSAAEEALVQQITTRLDRTVEPQNPCVTHTPRGLVIDPQDDLGFWFVPADELQQAETAAIQSMPASP